MNHRTAGHLGPGIFRQIKEGAVGVPSLLIVGSSFGSRRPTGPASGEHFLKFPA
jgi:hypothetical protein